MNKNFLLLLGCLFSVLVCIGQSITNVGTEFWIAFPPNYTSSVSHFLFISSNYSTSGTITSAFPGVDQNFTVVPGIVTEVTIPSGIALQPGIENKGIHIVANEPISLYGLSRITASTDAFLALPVEALGTDYRTLSYPVTVNNQGSCFSIVATQDGTMLSAFNHQTGGTTNVNLNMGETYHVEATLLGEDLSGSWIQSNFPVAVFGSSDIAQVPLGCNAADHLVEQMFPYYSWGKNFVTVPLAGRDESGDVFRVLAAEDATGIEINGTLVATINTGEVFETNLTGYNSIVSSKATLLAQFAKGSFCSGNIIGDPFMMQIPPREQFLTNYTVSTVAGFTQHWVNIVAPDYALGTILQDGILIPTGAFTQIGTTNFYGAQRSVTEGSHTFESTFPFGVFSYGWAFVDSYGYAGGGSLSPVGTVDSVSISPDTLYGELNVTSICVTAHVLNTLGDPVEGVLVTFNVSGIATITGNAYTNSFGDAQYCYTQTGVIPGIDHIYAEIFGFLSDTATVFWSYLPPCVNPSTGGSVGDNQSGCGSYAPAALTSTELPAGYTGTLEYKWQVSTTSSSAGFSDIPSSNLTSFDPGPITQTSWYKRLARVDCMPDWSGNAESNVVELTVIPPVPVSIAISASANDICDGVSVTYTGTAVNGGSAPAYQWQVNGTDVGTNNPVYTYNPASGDLVSCVHTSSEGCTSNNPATSNTITMIVHPLLPVSISISASKNPICDGLPVLITGVAVNSGSTPTYQWQVNSINVGTNNPVYTYLPMTNDIVTCTLTSSESCTSGNTATSNPVSMVVKPLPDVIFSPCFDTITTTDARPLSLKGGIPLGGIYSGTGVTASTFYPAIAGPGIHQITYTYLNFSSCSAIKTRTIQVSPTSVIACGLWLTDIRDNQVYPTVQIGSQCWMAANLNYGNEISYTTPQRDNCIPEKYILSSSLVPTPSFYQWDELMNYSDVEEMQGLCPPGWHVPSETDWDQLFAVYLGNGFAGSPLLYSGYSGFNALLSGAGIFNTAWFFPDFATLFWSSTSHGQWKAWAHGMNAYNYSVSYYPSFRANAFNVRCLMD